MKRFPLTTLIRLYELLKNSRLIPADAGVNNKEASSCDEAALVLIELFGGG
jgi:hypothetical protein